MKKVERSEKQERSPPDPEVVAKARRRRFTAEYKVDILRRADACTPGTRELGEMLRQEGLYTSHLSVWRGQRDVGALKGLEPRKRGRKGRRDDPVVVENDRLRLENERLKQRLAQAETIIDVQKKLSTLLGVDLATAGKGRTE